MVFKDQIYRKIVYLKLNFIFIICCVLVFIPIIIFADESPTTDSTYQTIKENRLPIVKDSNYIVEEYVSGLDWPTTMTFVNDEILNHIKINK